MKKFILLLIFVGCSVQNPVPVLEKFNSENPHLDRLEEIYSVIKSDVEWLVIWNTPWQRWDSLRVEILEPVNSLDNRPAILFAGGGGTWTVEREAYFAFRKFFAERGLVVFSIDYRVSRKELGFDCGKYLGADFASGVSWVRENSDVYRIDEDNVTGMGSSAGGGAASIAAYVDTSYMNGEHVPFNWIPNRIVSVSASIDWNPLFSCENLLVQIEAGEPEGFFLMSKNEPFRHVMQETYFAAKAKGIGAGHLFPGSAHGIIRIGQIRCAEIIYSWLK